VALVTGASRGVGKGIAVGLGEEGATVYLTGRSVDGHRTVALPGTLEETAGAVEAVGGRAIPMKCDHRSDDDLRAVF
jgi:NAD(P)-dependent dehydrogenase (short-subunit alcohol dehydrogenase family)